MPKNDYIEQVPIQRESTTVKKPLLDTGQRKIKVKEDKLAMEIAQQILSDARTQSNGIANGRFNTDYPLQTEHPELWVIPAAAEIKAAGLVPGMLRLAVGTVTGNEIGKQSTNIGQKIDSKLGTRVFAPTLGFIGGLGGYAFGSGFTGNMLSRIPRKYSYGPTNERTYWAEDQTPKYNSSQITGHFGKVKYYGPTMGKTTAVASNPKLVDFDDIIRQPSRTILDRYGFRNKSEMYNSGNQEAIKAYEDMLVKTLQDWRANPENSNLTLVASPTAIANPANTGFYFDNVPSIPSRDVFIVRNVGRGGTPEASALWYDSLLQKNPNLKIDNRFVSQIERQSYQSPTTSQLEIVPQKAFASDSPMTDAEWDAAYNKAIQSGDMAEVQRLRDLHFISKTPDNKLVNQNNSPHLVWHGSPEDWNVFDDWKRGTEDIIYFSTDKSYADQFTIPRKDWKIGMIPTKSSRSFYLYGKEPLDIGTDMDSQLVQERMRQAWLTGQNPDSAYGIDAWVDGMPLKQSNGIELGVLRRNQMKLSDPITYDDSKQIIPLSKRDDFGNSDIRYGYASNTATKGNLKQVDNFIENDVFPRLRKAGHNVEYSETQLPTLRLFNPEKDLGDRWLLNNDPQAKISDAWYHSPTNTATFRTEPNKTDYGLMLHEIAGHGIRYNIHPEYSPLPWNVFAKTVNDIPLSKVEEDQLLNWNSADQLYTPIESSLLNTSYSPFFKGGKAEGKLHDYGAVNTSLRGIISQKNNYVVGDKLDPFIDNINDVDLLQMLLDQPYTYNGTLQILRNATGINTIGKFGSLGSTELNNILSKHPEISKMLKRIKDTMKYVGGISAISAGMNNTPQKQE